MRRPRKGRRGSGVKRETPQVSLHVALNALREVRGSSEVILPEVLEVPESTERRHGATRDV